MKLAPLVISHCDTATSPGTDILGKKVLPPFSPQEPCLGLKHKKKPWLKEGKRREWGGSLYTLTRPAVQQDSPPPEPSSIPPLPHISPSGQEGNKRIQKLAPVFGFQFNY